jgi:hypothetical protein
MKTYVNNASKQTLYICTTEFQIYHIWRFNAGTITTADILQLAFSFRISNFQVRISTGIWRSLTGFSLLSSVSTFKFWSRNFYYTMHQPPNYLKFIVHNHVLRAAGDALSSMQFKKNHEIRQEQAALNIMNYK